MIKYPDYDRSILSVGSSVLKYFGIIDCEHKSLTDFVYAHPELRAKDLMDAFSKTKTIKGIFSAIGGDDSIRTLPY